MAKSSREWFIWGIRTAIGNVNLRAEATSDRIEVCAEERLLRNADLWLTAKYVEDFRDEDFLDIPVAQRTVLTASVYRFRAIAEQASRRAASKTESIAGKCELLRVAIILAPLVFAGIE